MNLLQIELWIPAILGFTTSFFCKIPKNEGASLMQRPPSYVFGIVWPILYLLLGYSWINTLDENLLKSKNIIYLLHLLCTILLTLWIIIYNCKKNKKLALYIIPVCISIIICIMCLHKHNWSKIALIPLLAWLLIAFNLNWHILD